MKDKKKHLNKPEIIRKTRDYVRAAMEKEGSGHDWWHIERVFKNAIAIAKREHNADLFIVQLGALLHDIADWKFQGGSETAGGKATARWLKQAGADDDTIAQVVFIVNNVSFKGLGTKSGMKNLEGKIVQDADRLDAIGAIGIARAFTYGGYRKRPFYDPAGIIRTNKTFAEYKRGYGSSTIHHFYEKLLHIKELMNTATGKKMAAQRHKFIETYLKEFYAEWDGKKIKP